VDVLDATATLARVEERFVCRCLAAAYPARIRVREPRCRRHRSRRGERCGGQAAALVWPCYARRRGHSSRIGPGTRDGRGFRIGLRRSDGHRARVRGGLLVHLNSEGKCCRDSGLDRASPQGQDGRIESHGVVLCADHGKMMRRSREALSNEIPPRYAGRQQSWRFRLLTMVLVARNLQLDGGVH
jgi:hypothetical protein